MKRILAMVLCLASARVHVQACWETEPSPDRLRAALFNVCLQSMRPYLPFDYRYSQDFDATVVDPDDNDRWRNAKEWVAELRQHDRSATIALHDVYEVQYLMPPDTFQERLAQPGTNSFLKALLVPSNKRYLEYMKLAKRLEEQTDDDPWDYHSPSEVYDECAGCDDVAYERSQNETSKFLRHRYLFQYVRIRARSSLFTSVQEATNNLGAVPQRSVVYGWLQMYRAIAMQDVVSTYLACAEAFRTSDAKKYRVMQMISPDEQLLARTLASAPNLRTRVTLLVMYGLRTTGPAQHIMEAIRDISPAAVNTPGFLFLVKREVNKLEDRLLTATLYGRPAIKVRDPQSSARLRLQNLLAFLQSVLPSSHGEYQSVLRMAEVHLLFLDTQYDLASRQLAGLEKVATRETSLKRQVLIERLYHSVSTMSVASMRTSNRLVSDLSELERLAKHDARYTAKALQGILELLSTRLVRGGDALNGALCYAKSQNAMYFDVDSQYVQSEVQRLVIDILEDAENTSAVESLLAHLEQSSGIDSQRKQSKRSSSTKHLLSQYLLHQPMKVASEYYEILARLYARKHDWTNVLLTYQRYDSKATSDVHRTMYRNPFVPPSWPYKSSPPRLFERAQFVQEMARLKDRIEEKQATTQERLKYAHGLLNASYYGHAWIVLKDSKSVRDGIGVRRYNDHGYNGAMRYIPINFTHFSSIAERPSDRNYFLLDDAREAYRYVYSHTTDRELKAKSLYGLHLCDLYRSRSIRQLRKQYADPWNYLYYDVEAFKFTRLRELYSEYSDTQTFAILHCPLLDSYIATSGRTAH